MRLSQSLLLSATSLVGVATTSFASLSFGSMHRHHDILAARDASTLMSGGKNNEGEAHGKIKPPSGSVFTSLPVGDDGEEIAAFWSKNPDNTSSTHAYIMIHGRLRNGDEYWTTMNDILQKAIDDNQSGADDNGIVVAPQFFSKKYNSKQYTKNMLAWGDVNAWQAGDPAVHPTDTKLTSFDALDSLVEEFMDTSKYPNMKNVTVVGHGGGGQLIQRYAIVASEHSSSDVHVRYIHGDSSSSAYFTKHRPTKISGATAKLPKKSSCKYYNTWRYGFDNFTGTAQGLKTPQQYFQQYITRDVVSIVGYQDVKSSGDTYCMAQIQGGTKRRDRNLAWWQYVNTLARTNEDLDGFPATFGSLPDWSSLSNNQISLRLAVVEDAAHDAEEVFGGSVGRSALFSKNVETGWRPKGWKAAPPIRATKGSASSSLSTRSLTSQAPSASAEQEKSSVVTSGSAPHVVVYPSVTLFILSVVGALLVV